MVNSKRNLFKLLKIDVFHFQNFVFDFDRIQTAHAHRAQCQQLRIHQMHIVPVRIQQRQRTKGAHVPHAQYHRSTDAGR